MNKHEKIQEASRTIRRIRIDTVETLVSIRMGLDHLANRIIEKDSDCDPVSQIRKRTNRMYEAIQTLIELDKLPKKF